MVNLVAIRPCSRAANRPIRSCLFKVALPGQDAGEVGRGVHLAAGEEPELLQLGRVQEMSLVADHHDAAVPLCGLGGQQVRCLGHHEGLEVAGAGAERPDDRHVTAPGLERRVGDVNHLMPCGVEGGDGGAQRDRLPSSDVPRHDSQRPLDDAEADPGDRLGVGLAGEQVPGGDGLPNGVRARPSARPTAPGSPALLPLSSPSPAGLVRPRPLSRVKSIFAPAPASSSWAAATKPR